MLTTPDTKTPAPVHDVATDPELRGNLGDFTNAPPPLKRTDSGPQCFPELPAIIKAAFALPCCDKCTGDYVKANDDESKADNIEPKKDDDESKADNIDSEEDGDDKEEDIDTEEDGDDKEEDIDSEKDGDDKEYADSSSSDGTQSPKIARAKEFEKTVVARPIKRTKTHGKC